MNVHEVFIEDLRFILNALETNSALSLQDKAGSLIIVAARMLDLIAQQEQRIKQLEEKGHQI